MEKTNSTAEYLSIDAGLSITFIYLPINYKVINS